MRKIDALLSEYGDSHQNSLNKTIHWICVPLIFFSVVGLFWSIPSDMLKSIFPTLGSYANWATVALVLTLIFYISLSVPIFIGMMVIVALCLGMCNWIESSFPGTPLWLISLVIFAAAWVGQFYGHKVEGKSPSFFKDLQFLLIGPAWLMHFIYKKMGLGY